MKLERIIINGIEYYQWVKLGEKNDVGDIFSDHREIREQRAKLIAQTSK